MKKISMVKLFFTVGAIYDGLLGGLFLFAADTVFRWNQVTPPNHSGYLHFPALLLIIFALMFMAVALTP